LNIDAGKYLKNNAHSYLCILNVLAITKKRNSIKFNYTLHGLLFEHVTSAEYIGNNI
jgi:hypothetical protein